VAGPDDCAGEVAGMGNGASRRRRSRATQHLVMADASSHPLLALVKEQGLIDDLQLEEVVQEQNRSGKTIAQILHDFGIVETETQLQIIATHLGTEVVDLTDKDLPPEVVALLP